MVVHGAGLWGAQQGLPWCWAEAGGLFPGGQPGASSGGPAPLLSRVNAIAPSPASPCAAMWERPVLGEEVGGSVGWEGSITR